MPSQKRYWYNGNNLPLPVFGRVVLDMLDWWVYNAEVMIWSLCMLIVISMHDMNCKFANMFAKLIVTIHDLYVNIDLMFAI